MNAETTYINPWHNPNSLSATHFKTAVKPKEYRGFKIYQRIPGEWDYVINGVCVTQRTGYSTAHIDHLLDGAGFDVDQVNELIAKHTQVQVPA